MKTENQITEEQAKVLMNYYKNHQKIVKLTEKQVDSRKQLLQSIKFKNFFGNKCRQESQKMQNNLSHVISYKTAREEFLQKYHNVVNKNALYPPILQPMAFVGNDNTKIPKEGNQQNGSILGVGCAAYWAVLDVVFAAESKSPSLKQTANFGQRDETQNNKTVQAIINTIIIHGAEDKNHGRLLEWVLDKAVKHDINNTNLAQILNKVEGANLGAVSGFANKTNQIQNIQTAFVCENVQQEKENTTSSGKTNQNYQTAFNEKIAVIGKQVIEYAIKNKDLHGKLLEELRVDIARTIKKPSCQIKTPDLKKCYNKVKVDLKLLSISGKKPQPTRTKNDMIKLLENAYVMLESKPERINYIENKYNSNIFKAQEVGKSFKRKPQNDNLNTNWHPDGYKKNTTGRKWDSRSQTESYGKYRHGSRVNNFPPPSNPYSKNQKFKQQTSQIR